MTTFSPTARSSTIYPTIAGSNLSYDRRLTLDRLIAAQAIARDATLITRSGKDFRKIEGLKLIEWETPE